MQMSSIIEKCEKDFFFFASSLRHYDLSPALYTHRFACIIQFKKWNRILSKENRHPSRIVESLSHG